jgi:hypothetical protein
MKKAESKNLALVPLRQFNLVEFIMGDENLFNLVQFIKTQEIPVYFEMPRPYSKTS